MKLERENFDKIRVFYETFSIGSTVKASKTLGLSPSWISRQIASLEQDIGAKLTFKEGRYLQLNSNGKAFMELIERIFFSYTNSIEKFKKASDSMKGNLVLCIPSFLSNVGFYEDLAPFLQTYPSLNLSINVTNKTPDLSMGESDIDIRPLIQKNELNHYKYLVTLDIGMYASKAYLQKHGFLEGLKDFENHNLIAFSKDCLFPYATQNWHITPINGHKQLTFIDSTNDILLAIESGLGIGPLSHSAATMSRVPLVPVLPEILNQSIDIYYTFSKVYGNSKAILELYKHLREGSKSPFKGRIKR